MTSHYDEETDTPTSETEADEDHNFGEPLGPMGKITGIKRIIAGAVGHGGTATNCSLRGFAKVWNTARYSTANQLVELATVLMRKSLVRDNMHESARNSSLFEGVLWISTGPIV